MLSIITCSAANYLEPEKIKIKGKNNSYNISLKLNISDYFSTQNYVYPYKEVAIKIDDYSKKFDLDKKYKDFKIKISQKFILIKVNISNVNVYDNEINLVFDDDAYYTKLGFNKVNLIYKKEPPVEKTNKGLALTFDDNFVDEWYSCRELFSNYNVRCTFFITKFHLLADDQINKLLELQSDGHEIACHTRDHANISDDYNRDPKLIDKYINEQILPSINLMKEHGFKVTSFAYPNGTADLKYEKELLKYFTTVRRIGSISSSAILFDPNNKSRVLYGAPMDNMYGYSIEERVRGKFKKAYNENKIIIFYCHKPVDQYTGNYQISKDRLEAIFKCAQEENLDSYTIQELNNL